MVAYIETFFKEENLKYLPADIRRKGLGSLSRLNNRQLIYVAQLCVRPTSRDRYLDQLKACVHPRPPRVLDDFMAQGPHYNYNMALLNLINEEIDYLNLNGGINHMPPLDWSQDPDRVNAYGKKLAMGLVRVISETLSGTLTDKLVRNFRLKTEFEEAERRLLLPPNYGGDKRPKTVPELFAAFRAIYRHFFCAWEEVKALKEDYDGGRISTAKPVKAAEPDLSPELTHPAVRTVVQLARGRKEAVLNVLQAFAEEVENILETADEEEVDAEVDQAYERHAEVLHAMSTSHGVCYSAMLSPTGECRKAGCKYSHERSHFKFAVLEQLVKLMKTAGYEDAVATGLLEAIKVKADWDKAAPPLEARATRPMRPGPQGRGVLPRPAGDNQIPFRTPQASRYAPAGVGQHKLHVTSHAPSHEPEGDREPPLEADSDDEEEADEEPAPDEDEPNEIDVLYAEIVDRWREVSRDGTHLYQMTRLVVADVPSMESEGGEQVMVEAALDTCATGSYMSHTLADRFRSLISPNAFHEVRSIVKMEAPSDHVSTEQVTLRLNWEHRGVKQESRMRFIILRTDNLQMILGLNAILFGGFLMPLFETLLAMQRGRRVSNLLSLRGAEETSYLCMHRGGAGDDDVDDVDDPEPGPARSIPDSCRHRDRAPQGLPSAASEDGQVFQPAKLCPNDSAIGERWRMLCPLANLTPREANSFPHFVRAHDEELARYLRGDHYSYVPRVEPFYVVSGDWVRPDQLAARCCIPNVNGRYTVWHDLMVWQWGVFVGFGAKARFIQMDSLEEVMEFLSPPDDDRPLLPFADERKRRYNHPAYRDERQKPKVAYRLLSGRCTDASPRILWSTERSGGKWSRKWPGTLRAFPAKPKSRTSPAPEACQAPVLRYWASPLPSQAY